MVCKQCHYHKWLFDGCSHKSSPPPEKLVELPREQYRTSGEWSIKYPDGEPDGVLNYSKRLAWFRKVMNE